MTSPLEMSPEEMRAIGYHVIDMLVDRYASLADSPAWSGATRAALDASLHEPPPEGPTPFDDVMQRLRIDVLPYTAAIDHPRFLAFIPAAPTWPGVMGDLIASGADIFQGTWLVSSGVSALELIVIDWFKEWLGLDNAAAGLLVSGGSAANLTAIACARLSRFGAHDDRAIIYHSSETHSSVPRAARILGFNEDQLRSIREDGAERMDVAALEQYIIADRAAGRIPFLVVANAGTTSTGAIDDVPAIARLATAHGMWLHVDAAYGGFAALTERGRTALRGIELGDSIALDPHKWLYQPFECGCIIVRDGALLERAFRVMPAYLQDTALPEADTHEDAASLRLPVNFANRGVQLTRSARVLKLWISLQTFGVDAFRKAIDECMDLALHAEKRVANSAKLELVTPARLGIICFRRRCNGDEAAHERCNAGILRALLDSGMAMISSTRVRGVFTLRFCVLNYRTRKEDLDRILDWIEDFDI